MNQLCKCAKLRTSHPRMNLGVFTTSEKPKSPTLGLEVAEYFGLGVESIWRKGVGSEGVHGGLLVGLRDRRVGCCTCELSWGCAVVTHPPNLSGHHPQLGGVFPGQCVIGT